MGIGIDVGLVLPMNEWPETGEKPTWAKISGLAELAEAVGFDTVWIADELIWVIPDWPGPRGWWDCLTMAGAVAASTSTVQVGTWVMSALHRNPGVVASASETLDEISGGRFVLGLGAGHSNGGAKEFGYPTDKTISRFAEAVEIIVPLLRGETVTFQGEFHHAHGAEVRPRGPRPGRVPLMMGGHSPRTMKLAATHADTWSAFATSSSLPAAFGPLIEQLDRVCDETGRDPASIGRSIGVFVDPGDAKHAEATGFGEAITGSIDQIVDTIGQFASIGVTRVEIIPWPPTAEVVESLAPLVAADS
jgi:alkanesulfonate monooxygenase SsuD/methylene tetrahydromethanopterin reductase-like flavin-dependent oxidoreductase (luciferase family)